MKNQLVVCCKNALVVYCHVCAYVICQQYDSNPLRENYLFPVSEYHLKKIFE